MKKKVILISIIVGIFALIMVTPILANSTSRWVELFYKDIKISLKYCDDQCQLVLSTLDPHNTK
jgi:ABC-type phosphate transport system permease subunit